MDGQDFEREHEPPVSTGEGGGQADGKRPKSLVSSTTQAGKSASAATGRTARRVFLLARRAARAEGAGESGLFRLIELHAVGVAGDAAVAISLAGTLFFQVPGGDNAARGQMALFLGLTMLPFAVVAPLIGPFLDRFSHGRRWAMGATLAIRACLAWVLAGAVAEDSLAMFPAALGCLICSKAYGVTRAAAVPRLAPPELGLVKANSRISLAGITGAVVSAPFALAAAHFGPEWSLRYAFVLFAFGTVLAILLPPQIDDTAGEQGSSLRRSKRGSIPRPVMIGLRANGGLRVLVGFLTLFMAFLLQSQQIPGSNLSANGRLAAVLGAAGLGNTLGILLGNVLRKVNPLISVLIALTAATAMAAVAALHWSLVTAVLFGLVTGVTVSFGKLSLDSMIQSHVDPAHRSTTFARSETLIQLAWVIGAFIGIALPLKAQLGLSVITLILIGSMLWVLVALRSNPNLTRTPADRESEAALTDQGLS